jgi:hypothetical protein
MRSESEEATRETTLKAQSPPPYACAVCGAPAKIRFCSVSCRLIAKIHATRRRRPLKDHVCQCGQCGKSFPVGRRRKVVPEDLETMAPQEVR